MQLNWTSQSTASANLVYPSVTDAAKGTTYPSVTIPLFLGALPIAVRTPRINEVDTLIYNDGGASIGFQAGFYGTPDPLKLQVSGWFITPTTPVFCNTFTPAGALTGGVFKVPVPTIDGASSSTQLTNLTGTTYADLIYAYVEGRMSVDANKRGTRVDPTSFCDGYGNVYSSPKLLSMDCTFTPTSKKQTFTMTLWIEN